MHTMIKSTQFILILLLASNALGADWPTYRHDYRRSGVTPENLDISLLREVWSFRALQPPQPAWPGPAKWDAYAGIRDLSHMRNYDPCNQVIAVGNAIYFGTNSDNSLHALDARTGESRWTFTADAPIRIAPTYYQGRLYFGADDGHAYCLDAHDGSLIWRSTPPRSDHWILNNGRYISRWPCRTGVLVEKGIAYFGLSLLPWESSYLCAVNADNGRAEGSGTFTTELYGATMEGGLLADQEHLLALGGRVEPFTFSKATGDAEGSLSGGGGSFATIATDGRVFHGPGNKTGWLTESAAETHKNTATHNGKVEVLCLDEGFIFLSKKDVSRIDSATMTDDWSVPFTTPRTAILGGETLFVGGDDHVRAYSIKDGTQQWQATVQGRAYGLTIANSALLVSTDEGVIHCFRTDDTTTEIELAARPPEAVRVESERRRTTPLNDKRREVGLVGHWVFEQGMGAAARRRGVADPERFVPDLAGRNPGNIYGPIQLREAGGVEALMFDGAANSVLLSENHRQAKLPSDAISAAAWVRVDRPTRWGGVIGAVQDNGDDERGWVLGYNNDRFSIGLAGTGGEAGLTYLAAPEPFQKSRWYHLVGSYDGESLKLYIDGSLKAESRAQQGPIDDPAPTFFEIGAYHDQDEFFRMEGMVHEIKLYDRSISADEIRRQYEEKASSFPVPIRLKVGPFAQFISQDRAVIRWQTNEPCSTVLRYTERGLTRDLGDPRPKTVHEVTIEGLGKGQVGEYVIESRIDSKRAISPEFELDTNFNYCLPDWPKLKNAFTEEISVTVGPTATQILEETGIDQGIAVVLGCVDGSLAYELGRQSQLRVLAVDDDPDRVSSIRDTLKKTGVYGTRITVLLVDSLDELPIVGRSANLVVSERSTFDRELVSSPQELYRILRPNGGVVLIGLGSSTDSEKTEDRLQTWFNEAELSPTVTTRANTIWAMLVRGPLEGAGEWSHLYGKANNAAFGDEVLNNATTTDQLDVHWIGRPGPRAQPDRNGRKPAPLSINGRLFVQGLHRLIGVDAFNGTILWSLEIPPLERFNMPRDCGNWCGDDNWIYAAIKGHCWRIDAQTGDVVEYIPVPSGSREEWSYEWGYVARAGELLLGSTVKEGAPFTNYWGGASEGWYDSRSGPATFKVCSEKLFALDAASSQPHWTYERGLIINSTISATDDHVYFVECRHPEVLTSRSRRVGVPELWQDQYLVALDLNTGEIDWEKPIDVEDGIVVFWMATAEDRLVLCSSTEQSYFVNTFDALTGEQLWNQSFGWIDPNGDHGKAMSRPAIVNGRVFVRPRVMDLETGELLSIEMPGGGCGTYAATAKAFFFRSGNVTAWNSETGSSTSWDRLRPGCWLSTVPANGMLLSPEAGGGCSCGSWIEASIGFMPH